MTNAEQLADNILKAAGSGLKNYTMQKTRQEIIDAAKKGIEANDALVEALKAVHEAGRMSENSRAQYMAEIALNALKLSGAE